MRKRTAVLLTMLLTAVMIFTTFAYDFAGKTYKGSKSQNGATASMTAKFISGNKVALTMALTGTRTQRETASYEVAGDYINIYEPNGNYYYFAIDTDKRYGEDAILLLDGNGKLVIALKRVTGSGTKSSGAGKKKKRR